MFFSFYMNFIANLLSNVSVHLVVDILRRQSIASTTAVGVADLELQTERVVHVDLQRN